MKLGKNIRETIRYKAGRYDLFDPAKDKTRAKVGFAIHFYLYRILYNSVMLIQLGIDRSIFLEVSKFSIN